MKTIILWTSLNRLKIMVLACRFLVQNHLLRHQILCSGPSFKMLILNIAENGIETSVKHEVVITYDFGIPAIYKMGKEDCLFPIFLYLALILEELGKLCHHFTLSH